MKPSLTLLTALLLAPFAAPRAADTAQADASLAREKAAAGRRPVAFTAAADLLADGFRTPPPETRPWCYWYWMNDNISKDGITRDLEAMARVGIGEALLGNIVDPDMPIGDVRIFSPRWWELTEHAIREAKRTGVNLGIFNSPGWSQSGGPWVKTNQAMRYLVSSETRVTGPQRFAAKLPAPAEIFQDVAVLALPAPKADGERLAAEKSQVACEPLLADLTKLVDGDLLTVCELPDKSKPLAVTFECAAPFTARSLTLRHAAGSFIAQCKLAAADDSGEFRTVREFVMDRRGLSRPKYAVNVGFMIHGATVVSFPAVTARKFRLTITLTVVENPPVGAAKADTAVEKPTLSEIELSGAARLESNVEKQLGKMHPTPGPAWNSYVWPVATEPESAAFTVAPGAVLNLTSKLAPDGTLNWDVPAGEWIILRTGMTPTGASNHPTTDEGRGYEVDKMNRDAIFAHYDAMVGKLVKRMPKSDRSALRHIVIDSYEVGSQNWTEGFGKLFRQTYGYDATPWLPVLTGRIVGSANQSDRFLWDLRRLVADRIAYDYVGGLRDAAHRHGLRLWLENYGHWGFPAEFLQYGGQSDDLGGEFWIWDDAARPSNLTELRCASSAAHSYGKGVVFAEAFTSARSFLDFPARMKPLGDWAFCQGINHLVLTLFIHQPWEDRKPGVNAWFGTEFNRHNTWFNQSKAWIDYLRRGHWMLQQGVNVADVAYFIGEDTPKMTGPLLPALPAGHDYDFINAEALLKRAQVKGGRVAIPNGPAYRILVLPPGTTMRPEVLRKIRDLVAVGTVVVGTAPTESPSLQNYPAADTQVKKLAAELWGDCDGKKITERVFGKGRVFCGVELPEVFERLGLTPDIERPDGLNWTHRQTPEADIYFVANPQPTPRLTELSFRVAGRAPEIWHADSGETEPTALFAAAGDRTRVTLPLDANGSAFVVFRRPAPGASIATVKKDGAALASGGVASPVRVTRDGKKFRALVSESGNYAFTQTDGKELKLAAKLPAPVTVSGGWKLQFPGQPVRELAEVKPWQEFADDAVKYFSGTATYETALDIPAEWLGAGRRLTLDLGKVDVLAEVSLNGKDLGVAWKPPFAVDLTAAAKPGKNRLVVKVTNNWQNRLIGDSKLPENERTTFTTAPALSPRTELLPSGLSGPVRLLPAREVELTATRNSNGLPASESP